MFDLNVTGAVVATSFTLTGAAFGAAAGGGAGAAETVGAAVAGGTVAGSELVVEGAGAGTGVGVTGATERLLWATNQVPPATTTSTIAARNTFRADPPSSRAVWWPAKLPSVRRWTSARPPAVARAVAGGPRGVSRTREALAVGVAPSETEVET